MPSIMPKAYGAEVVSHSSVTTKSLTTSQLRRIFSMRQVRWADNQPIVVFVLSSQNDLHQEFCKLNLQIFPYQLDRIWNKLTFSGLGTAPFIVETEDELIEKIKSTPGAIGYVRKYSKDSGIDVIKISN